MGIKLGPLLETRPIKVEELANQKVAIDGYNILYQFLSSIRQADGNLLTDSCLLYTSPSPRDRQKSRMPSSA